MKTTILAVALLSMAVLPASADQDTFGSAECMEDKTNCFKFDVALPVQVIASMYPLERIINANELIDLNDLTVVPANTWLNIG